MDLLNDTPARKIALEIQSITSEMITYNESRLARLYELVNTPGQQSNVLAEFGPNGVVALTAYTAFCSALALVKPVNNAPQPNLKVFVPQPDGSMIYVEPEPEPEDETITP